MKSIQKQPTALMGLVVATLCLASPNLSAQLQPTHDVKYLVGTKHSPPFAFKDATGNWTGISIELWRELADKLELDYDFEELPLDEMLSALESGDLDVGVAAISVTAERYERLEFCHPHFTTGLGIAVAQNRNGNAWLLLRRILTKRLLRLAAFMVGIVAVCGLLFWLVERKRNETMFGGQRRQGINMGIWWSTILLLGHKGVIPVTLMGRLLACGAMLASLVLLSTVTGVIASVLTVQQLEVGIAGPSDLRHTRVATVRSSTSQEYLRQRRIPYRLRATAAEALDAVVNGQADAVVYDEAMLQYLANTDYLETIQVLPVTFNTQEYAIALEPNSPLRLSLNESLLRFRASDNWDELLYRYLGTPR